MKCREGITVNRIVYRKHSAHKIWLLLFAIGLQLMAGSAHVLDESVPAKIVERGRNVADRTICCLLR